MEDNKKKYEEAMLRMKKWVEGSEITEPKEVAEFVFPELRESEDERIRKHLLKHFSNKTKEEWNGMPIKNIIAWLENQGEHANFRNKIQIGDEVTRNEDGALVNLSQFKRMVKQREQKPIEWNADDLLKRNQIITILKEYNRTELIAWLEKQGEQKPANYSVWVGGIEVNDNYLTKEEAEKLADKYRKDSYEDVAIEKIEQKPIWSKEDYDEMGVIACHLDNMGNEAMAKSLLCIRDKYNVKSKPAWSEEDDRIRYAICDTLDRIDEHVMKYNNHLTHQQVKDWLKSLKERMKGE